MFGWKVWCSWHGWAKQDLRSAVREAMGWLPYAVPQMRQEEVWGKQREVQIWKPKWRRGQGAGRGGGRPGDRDSMLWRVDGEQPFFLTSLSFLSLIFCPWGKLPMEKFCSITHIGEDLLKEEGKEWIRQLLWRQVSQGSPWSQPSLCTWCEKFINHSNGQICGGQTALCHHSAWE